VIVERNTHASITTHPKRKILTQNSHRSTQRSHQNIVGVKAEWRAAVGCTSVGSLKLVLLAPDRQIAKGSLPFDVSVIGRSFAGGFLWHLYLRFLLYQRGLSRVVSSRPQIQ
jgi:hypothetical protein